MTSLAYTRAELLRTVRNRRFFILALGFPLALYFLIAIPNRGITDLGGTGVSAPLYYMVGLAAFGAMATMLSSGTRIAGERAIGWSRQLRLTPLPPRSYIRAKALTAYAMVLLTHEPALRRRDRRGRAPAGRGLAADDGAHAHRPRAFRRPRVCSSATCSRPTRSAR